MAKDKNGKNSGGIVWTGHTQPDGRASVGETDTAGETGGRNEPLFQKKK